MYFLYLDNTVVLGHRLSSICDIPNTRNVSMLLRRKHSNIAKNNSNSNNKKTIITLDA